MLHSAWNGNGIVTIGSEMLRQGAATTCTAMEWRSKVQTSNGIEWKSDATAMDARRSFDKQRQSLEKRGRAKAKSRYDMLWH